jgi:hypothetical protein
MISVRKILEVTWNQKFRYSHTFIQIGFIQNFKAIQNFSKLHLFENDFKQIITASDLIDLEVALDKLEVKDCVIAREIKNNNIRIVIGKVFIITVDNVLTSALWNTDN